MSHDLRTDFSCELYVSGERVDPSLVSGLTGLQGVGFKKGDEAISGGKPIIRSYGTWRMLRSEGMANEHPQDVMDGILSEVVLRRERFIKAVEECSALFRLRARVDMVDRTEIFSVQIASDRVAELSGIISHFEIVAT